MSNATKLPQEAIDFDDFLNTPPEYEDRRTVREFRHDAYRRWEKVCDAIRAALAGAQPPDQIATLRAALEDARNYIEATTLNAASPKTRANYGGCLRRIDAALSAAPAQCADEKGAAGVLAVADDRMRSVPRALFIDLDSYLRHIECFGSDDQKRMAQNIRKTVEPHLAGVQPSDGKTLPPPPASSKGKA